MLTRYPRCWTLLLSLVFPLLGNPAAARAELEVVVPAYFYPAGGGSLLWQALDAAASRVKLTAIMNPGSGPGLGPDANYDSVVNSLRSAGGRVIGYVHSSWGARNLATILDEIDDYNSWYNIDGIFVDEMATGLAQVNYYAQIYNHVKSIHPEWEVIGNPGTNTNEFYLSQPTADRLMISEDVGSAYPGYSPAPWVADYERQHFVHLIHSEPSATTMQNNLELAISRNAGAIYITDDVLNNPWDTLASYWQTELAAIEQLNAAILPGDMNEDLQVDQVDLTRWLAGYGTVAGATHYAGDADADGDVDGRDFLAWQSDYGLSARLQLAAGLALVPETTSAYLLLTALGLQALRCSR